SGGGDVVVGVLFLFSRRRRDRRLVSDWSSDVCSSDLDGRPARTLPDLQSCKILQSDWAECEQGDHQAVTHASGARKIVPRKSLRSEERRVGKEGRDGWWA